MKRYYLYDLYIRRVLIDTKNKTISIYCDITPTKLAEFLITAPKIRGLQRRLQKVQTLENSYVYNIFIYTYMMNDKQRQRCKFNPNDYDFEKLVLAIDSIEEIRQALEGKTTKNTKEVAG